ncbi:hypothetical protein ACFV3R_25550 [Streptomyces sp. NPDC059740]|uniref:hypothetical protein n=1 Tax=Streptomyces sp. NPDC059740 TaxID=3346926 RepID=UPI0036496B10
MLTRTPVIVALTLTTTVLAVVTATLRRRITANDAEARLLAGTHRRDALALQHLATAPNRAASSYRHQNAPEGDQQ